MLAHYIFFKISVTVKNPLFLYVFVKLRNLKENRVSTQPDPTVTEKISKISIGQSCLEKSHHKSGARNLGLNCWAPNRRDSLARTKCNRSHGENEYPEHTKPSLQTCCIASSDQRAFIPPCIFTL